MPLNEAVYGLMTTKELDTMNISALINNFATSSKIG